MLEVAIEKSLGDFSLKLEGEWPAKSLGVFGKSGAGKTLFLQLISGLQKPDQGSLKVFGETLYDSAKKIWVPPHKRRFATVFQDDRLFPHLSIRENLLFGYKHLPPSERRIDFDAVVDELELTQFLIRKPDQLSGGQRQRVSLGRALLCSPRLLLCDEPLSALDSQTRGNVMAYLIRASEHFQIPMLYVSHDMLETQTLCEELLILSDGKRLAQGSFREIVHEPSIFENVLDRRIRNVWKGESERDRFNGSGHFFLELGYHPVRPVRCVTLDAGAVAVAKSEIKDVSMRNHKHGIIERITHCDETTILEINCGAPVFAQITRNSAAQMELSVGMKVWCYFKCSSLTAIEVTSKSS